MVSYPGRQTERPFGNVYQTEDGTDNIGEPMTTERDDLGEARPPDAGDDGFVEANAQLDGGDATSSAPVAEIPAPEELEEAVESDEDSDADPDVTIEEPSAEADPDEPVAEEPGAEDDTDEPVPEDDAEQPAAEDDAEQPAAEDDAEQPAAEQPAAEDDTDEPGAEDDAEEQATEGETSDTPEAASEQLAAATSTSSDVVPERKRRLGFRSRWALGLSILLGLLVIGVSGISVAAYQYAREYDGKIMPGATIAGVDVGGMSKAQAMKAVKTAIRPQLKRDIRIFWQAKRWHATPAELGAKSNAKRAVEDALYESANASFADKVRMRLGGGLGFDRDVAIRYPKDGVHGFVQGLASSFDQEPSDAHLDYEDTWITVVPEQVGREVDVDKSSSKLLHALRHGASSSGLAVSTKKPEVSADEFDMVLLLHIGENRLYVYEDGKITHKYTVATGQSAYPTPQGEYEVINKRYMPTWVNPAPDGWGSDMPASIPPGPGNPLGVRALDWSASGIRFHSTSDLGSLGHNASHGCVRMSAADVIELYDMVDIGTPIVSIQTAPYS
jgi:outer membrane biosynthesis protein TonB